MRVPISPHPHQHLLLSPFYYSHPNGCETVSHCSFDLISLMANDTEHLFRCSLAICISSLRWCISSFICLFLNWGICLFNIKFLNIFFTLVFVCMCVCIHIWLANIFSQSVVYLFTSWWCPLKHSFFLLVCLFFVFLPLPRICSIWKFPG